MKLSIGVMLAMFGSVLMEISPDLLQMAVKEKSQNSCLAKISDTFEFNSRFSPQIEQYLTEHLEKQEKCAMFIASLKKEVSHFVEWTKWKTFDSATRRQLASNLFKTLHQTSSIKIANNLPNVTDFESILSSGLFEMEIFAKEDLSKATCAHRFQSTLKVFEPLSPELSDYLNSQELDKCMRFVQEVKRSIFTITKLSEEQWAQLPGKVRKSLVQSTIPMLYVHSMQEVARVYEKNLTDQINEDDLFFGNLFAEPAAKSEVNQFFDDSKFEHKMAELMRRNESGNETTTISVLPLFSFKGSLLLVGFVVVVIMVLLGLRALDMIPKI